MQDTIVEKSDKEAVKADNLAQVAEEKKEIKSENKVEAKVKIQKENSPGDGRLQKVNKENSEEKKKQKL